MYIYKYFVAFMHSLILHLCMCICYVFYVREYVRVYICHSRDENEKKTLFLSILVTQVAMPSIAILDD